MICYGLVVKFRYVFGVLIEPSMYLYFAMNHARNLIEGRKSALFWLRELGAEY